MIVITIKTMIILITITTTIIIIIKITIKLMIMINSLSSSWWARYVRDKSCFSDVLLIYFIHQDVYSPQQLPVWGPISASEGLKLGSVYHPRGMWSVAAAMRIKSCWHSTNVWSLPAESDQKTDIVWGVLQPCVQASKLHGVLCLQQIQCGWNCSRSHLT